MKKSNTPYTSTLFGQRIGPKQIATFGLAISVVLQCLLPCAVAADNVMASQVLSYAEENPGFGEVLMKADPTRGLQEEKPMTDEEFEAVQKNALAQQRLEARTQADKEAVVQSLAATINRLPVLATATVGVAFNKGASVQEGLSAINATQIAEEGAQKLSEAKFAESV